MEQRSPAIANTSSKFVEVFVEEFVVDEAVIHAAVGMDDDNEDDVGGVNPNDYVDHVDDKSLCDADVEDKGVNDTAKMSMMMLMTWIVMPMMKVTEKILFMSMYSSRLSFMMNLILMLMRMLSMMWLSW